MSRVMVRVTSTADTFVITAVIMASSISVDDVFIVDIHGAYIWGLPLVKWGLPLSVPLQAT